MDFLWVGLGNPGTEYEDTRHNIGFRALDSLWKQWGDGGKLRQKKFQGVFGKATQEGKVLGFLKPHTFMNRSGRSVLATVQYYKMPCHRVFLLYDDVDTPFASLRLRLGGGAGGHNGVQSIIECLGTQQIPRIRLGIGRPHQVQADLAEYVLAPFPREERDEVSSMLTKTAQIGIDILAIGFEQAMNRWNRK